MVPVGDWAKDRLNNLSETDKIRDESKVGSGFGKNISKWVGRKMVYPNNVLYLATECSNRNHSAAFPVELPSWFIRLFTERDDMVLDPFIGSGTTAVAAIQEGRKFIGIDTENDYIELSQARISEIQIKLPAIAEETENYQIDD